jgi:hypothetical protein
VRCPARPGRDDAGQAADRRGHPFGGELVTDDPERRFVDAEQRERVLGIALDG